MYFETELSSEALIAICVNLIAALFLATLYRSRIMRVTRHQRQNRPDDGQPPLAYPSISIIVYTKDNPEGLATLLPELFSQDYPAGFEVIVTTDGRSETASDIVTRLSTEHRNLRLTYVPDEAHALSRKKLALTLGIKSAHNNYVLLTTADAILPSEHWLTLIGRHFAEGKDVVIGHSRPLDTKRGGNGKPLTAFDSLYDKTTYLSSAIARRPYRGSAGNIAFRRQLFFDNNGFAESVGYHHGEDDIFVSKIATGANCVTELDPQSQIAIKCHDLKSRHHDFRQQHRFTGRYVSKRSRRFFNAGPAAAWTWAASAAYLGAVFYPNLLPVAIAIVTGTVWMAVTAVAWKSAAVALGIKIKGWTAPFLMMIHPIYNLQYRFRAKSFSDRNYTWSKP